MLVEAGIAEVMARRSGRPDTRARAGRGLFVEETPVAVSLWHCLFGRLVPAMRVWSSTSRHSARVPAQGVAIQQLNRLVAEGLLVGPF